MKNTEAIASPTIPRFQKSENSLNGPQAGLSAGKNATSLASTELEEVYLSGKKNTQGCKGCGSTDTMLNTGSGPHVAKLSCADCGRFHKWVSRQALSAIEVSTLVDMAKGCESEADYTDVVQLFAQLEPEAKPQLKEALAAQLEPDKFRRIREAAIALATGEAK